MLVCLRYVKLNVEVMKRVKPGGLLFTFTCSALIVNGDVTSRSAKDRTRQDTRSLPHGQYFTALLQEAARLAGRNVLIIRELNGCDDHPIHIANPQSKYLAGLLLRIN